MKPNIDIPLHLKELHVGKVIMVKMCDDAPAHDAIIVGIDWCVRWGRENISLYSEDYGWVDGFTAKDIIY